jgi:hypothetical protein
VLQQLLNRRLGTENSLINIANLVKQYSHQVINIPIFSECFGIEVEVKLKEEYQNLEIGDENLQQMISAGLVIERDSSVDIEFKTPILSPSRAWEWVTNPYWKRLSKFQNKRFCKQGIHIHINMDPFFDTDKVASNQTIEFLQKVAMVIEDNINFSRVFARLPNRYCRSAYKGLCRYCWVNFNLRRKIGKTLEIRGFKSIPERLPEFLFKAKYIANIFIRALLKWREDGRPPIEEWFENRLLLKLLTRKELFFTLFALHIKEFPFPKETDSLLEILERGIKNPLEVF